MLNCPYSDRPQAGYSLIQMAIALIVIGIFLAPLGALYSMYQRDQTFRATYDNVQNAMDRVQLYRKTTGAFPCPAALNAPRGAAYGRQVDCRTGAIAALNPGECANGICVEETVRGDLAGTGRRVIVGMLPFRDLQIDEQKAFDGYRGRLVYAVTQSMTDQATYNETKGAIAVRNETGTPLTSVDGSVGFLVFSHGPNRVGSYGTAGTLTRPCTDANAASPERENCNVGFETGTAPSTQSIYVATQQDEAGGATAFDDQISYFSAIGDALWRRTDADLENIQDLSPQFVGIGTATPATAFHIAPTGTSSQDSLVVGSGTADGKVRTPLVCDNTGANCFDPRVIAGDNTTNNGTTDNGGEKGMKCPAGTYMVGIGTDASDPDPRPGKPICAPIVVSCPATKVLKGSNPTTGEPICVNPPGGNCPAETKTVCATGDVSLPEGTDLAYQPSSSTFFTLGVSGCKQRRYQCRNGTWGVPTGGDYGNCNIVVPATRPDPAIPCRASNGSTTPYNGQTYSGTCSYSCSNTTTATCTLPAPGDCVCVGGSDPETKNCNDPLFSGNRMLGGGTIPASWSTSGSTIGGTMTRRIIYAPSISAPGTCIITRSDWDTSGCYCNSPTPNFRTDPIGSCPSPLTGGIFQRKVFNSSLAVCNWVNVGPPESQCSCPEDKPDTKPKECPHTCSEPRCEDPDPLHPDIWTLPLNRSTCAYEGACPPHQGPATFTSAGSCKPKNFTWQNTGTGTEALNDARTPSDPVIGRGCSCSDHINTELATPRTTVTCYYADFSNKQMQSCSCR